MDSKLEEKVCLDPCVKIALSRTVIDFSVLMNCSPAGLGLLSYIRESLWQQGRGPTGGPAEGQSIQSAMNENVLCDILKSL